MTFEDRALIALKELVTEPPSGRKLSHKAWAATAGAAASLVAVVAATAFVIAPGPAFAVHSNSDGTVTVTVNSWEDTSGLEQALRERGYPAVVQYVPATKACMRPWFNRPAGLTGTRTAAAFVNVSQKDGKVTYVLDKKPIHSGETLILGATGPRSELQLGWSIATGKVSACHLIDRAADGEWL
jgi:hypothetical protein